MRRLAKFVAALLAALVLHTVAVRWFDSWSVAVDLFLLVAIFNSLDGNTLAGLAGGLAAGWMTDAVYGSPFGLFGAVDTILGYGTAFAVQRVVIQRPSGAAWLFALVATAQQLLVLGLSGLLSVGPEVPAMPWVATRIAVTGLLGAALFAVRQRLSSRVDLWKRTRRTRIRLD